MNGTHSSEPSELRDLPYYGDHAQDDLARKVCRLDLLFPTSPKGGFPLIIWIHGGGLTGGERAMDEHVMQRFVAHGAAVANVDYRLSPQVNFPAYVEDAARAVAFAIREGTAHGVDLGAVYIAGHSAGGYIAALLAMDTRYLAKAGVPVEAIAGFIPVSASLITHFQVRAERGIANDCIVVDEAAPLFYVRKNAAPLLLIMGDNDIPARLEENQLFLAAISKVSGNTSTSLIVVADRDHGGTAHHLMSEGDPAGLAIIEFIARTRRYPNAPDWDREVHSQRPLV